ncbi:MAG: hypothetical protein M3Q03_11100 [Chloroflexota bacterium]|nr:hypothetical protein [Chloroflexota bacterium]
MDRGHQSRHWKITADDSLVEVFTLSCLTTATLVAVLVALGRLEAYARGKTTIGREDEV